MTDAVRWGIEPGYHDVAGQWHDTPTATTDAILAIMGAEGDDPPPPAAIIAAPGRPHPHLVPGQLTLEDGTTVDVAGDLPYDLPLGYHRFRPFDDGAETPLIVGPGRCYLPDDLRLWGWAAQLYAARSRASWGMGDLADLRRLGQWSAAQGAGFALINPLHAALPVGPQQPSPYFASSRSFHSPLYLRIEEVPGARDLPDLASLAAAGQALNADRLIDRDEVWRLKSAALEELFDRFPGDAAFERYLADQGEALARYAVFCALCEEYGVPWEKWPVEVRRPDAEGVASFAATPTGARRSRYHAWLQWLFDRQLAAAGETIGLVQDLAIGADAGGADGWTWQDCIALDARVGAPPDEFNPDGQNWGLPPFDPWRLRAQGYRPFIELARAGLRHAGGMRFDHVMGLFRLFWIPEGATPAEGAYVRYPAGDLLDILALESQRAQAFVVGEDLGTVEPSCRTELAERRVLSYRLLWFESTPPDGGEWPRQALAAVTTHDLPTVAGVWTGADLAARQERGLPTNTESERALRDKLRRWTDVRDDEPVEEVIARVYRLLAAAPCALVAAALDDAVAVAERPNMPGTADEWPNWRIALPVPVEEIERRPLAASIAAALSGRGGPPSGST
ncbi:MAG TPA: 4-alpha-glucanotransferase [Acidimicrobiales bacterium]|jgi:4-alpha-glucanotransferase|nr:4-alpha-glucanotransferase [Acidimicrobiales bacterium]